MVVDKCSSKLSCGSLSPITPCPATKCYPNKNRVNDDVKIIVTDSLNNSVFMNHDGTDVGIQEYHTALEASLVPRLSQSSSKLFNASSGPTKAWVNTLLKY